MTKRKRRAEEPGAAENGSSIGVSHGILPLFASIISVKPQIANEAAAKLIGSLEASRTKHTAGSISSGKKHTRSLEQVLEEYDFDLVYTLKRLLRGLASSVENARAGFATVLVRVLQMMPALEWRHINALLAEAIPMTGLSKGTEERDQCLGRLFAYAVFVRAGLVGRHSTRYEDLETTSKALMVLGSKKAWLLSSAWKVLCEYLDQAITLVEAPWRPQFLRWAAEEVANKSQQGWFPELLAVVLLLQKANAALDWSWLKGRGFKHDFVLHRSNLGLVSKILRDAPEKAQDTDLALTRGGLYRPQPSFCWETIMDMYFHDPPHRDLAPFSELWHVVVEEHFFASTTSDARRLWGFSIYERAATRLNSSECIALLTRNYLNTWMRHLSSADKALHVAAVRASGAAQEACRASLQTGLKYITTVGTYVIPHPNLHHGGSSFIESILMQATPELTLDYVQFLLATFAQSSTESTDDLDSQKEKARRQGWVLNQCLALARNGSIIKHESWIFLVLDFLTRHALFAPALPGEEPAAMAPTLLESAQMKLLSVLGELLRASAVGSSETDKEPSIATSWVVHVLREIQRLSTDAKLVAMMSSTARTNILIASALEHADLRRQLGSISDSKIAQIRAFEVLYTHMGLLACIDSELDSTETFADLDACFARFAGKSRSSEKGPAYIEVLVDLMLSLLAKSSIFLRLVVEYVFNSFASEMTEGALDLMLNVLEPPKEEEKELDGGDEVDSDEMNFEPTAGVANGFSALNGHVDMLVQSENAMDQVSSSEEGTNVDESGSDESSSVDSSEDEGDAPEVDSSLRAEVAKALQINDSDMTEMDVASDTDDDEEILMTDEQMLKIDESLAAIFKQRTESRKARRIALEDDTQFKHKVLDLLGLFVRRQPESTLVIHLIPPLVGFSSTANSSMPAGKTKTLLKEKIFKSKIHPSHPERAMKALKELHTIAGSAQSVDDSVLCGLGNAYLIRCILSEERRSAQFMDIDPAAGGIMHLYHEAVADFLQRKASRWSTRYFLEYASRYPAMAIGLVTPCLSAIRGRIVSARRKEALKIIRSVIQNVDILTKLCRSTVVKILPEMANTSLKLLGDATEFAADENTTDQHKYGTLQMKEWVKDMIMMIRATKKIIQDDSVWARGWQSSTLLDTYAQFATSPKFESLTVFKHHRQTIINLFESQSQQREVLTNGPRSGENTEPKSNV